MHDDPYLRRAKSQGVRLRPRRRDYGEPPVADDPDAPTAA
jgi:hypothetical protein